MWPGDPKHPTLVLSICVCTWAVGQSGPKGHGAVTWKHPKWTMKTGCLDPKKTTTTLSRNSDLEQKHVDNDINDQISIGYEYYILLLLEFVLKIAVVKLILKCKKNSCSTLGQFLICSGDLCFIIIFQPSFAHHNITNIRMRPGFYNYPPGN